MRVPLAALLLVALPAIADPVPLLCARSGGEYPDAAMELNPRGPHVLNVTFVGQRPTRSRADWSLRDCLFTATKLDSTRDIEAHAWFRERGADARPQPLEPELSYKAVPRRVVNR